MAGLARGLRHTNVAERRHVSDVASAQHLIVCDKGAFGVDAMCGGGAVVVGEEGAEEGCGEVGVQGMVILSADLVQEGLPGCDGIWE